MKVQLLVFWIWSLYKLQRGNTKRLDGLFFYSVIVNEETVQKEGAIQEHDAGSVAENTCAYLSQH